MEESGDLDPPDEILPAQPVRDLNQAILGRENFDRWIFGDGFGEEKRRTALDARLTSKVEDATQQNHLTIPQRDKLRLAGIGDIKRYLDRVEEKRREFEQARRDITAGRRVLSQVLPLSREFHAGPFGEYSLFAKTLRKLENDRETASRER